MIHLSASRPIRLSAQGGEILLTSRFVRKMRLGVLILAGLLHASAGIAAEATAATNAPAPASSAAIADTETRLVQSLTTTGASSATNTPPATNAPASTNSLAQPLDDKHKLVIGDRLSFKIKEDEEDPKSLIVADNGELEVPYIGRVTAETKTCKQLAQEIKTALEKDYYYTATVSIAVDLMAKTHGRVYLIGALRMPGPQDIPSDEVLTLSKAILRSGGFSDFADKKNVKITRKTGPNESDKQTFVVNVGEIYDKGAVESDIQLEPGDMILVPDRKIRF